MKALVVGVKGELAKEAESAGLGRLRMNVCFCFHLSMSVESAFFPTD